MAATLTDEMRAAVHDEDCVRLGHDLSLDNMLIVADQKTMRPEIRSADPNKMPHLHCRRCARVWLVLEDAGIGYADAENKFAQRLKNSKQMRMKP